MALNRRLLQLPAFSSADTELSTVLDWFCENLDFTITEEVSDTKRRGYFNKFSDITVEVNNGTNSDGYYYLSLYFVYCEESAIDTALTAWGVSLQFYNNLSYRNYEVLYGDQTMVIQPVTDIGNRVLYQGRGGFFITSILEKGTDIEYGKLVICAGSTYSNRYFMYKFPELDKLLNTDRPLQVLQPNDISQVKSTIPYYNKTSPYLSRFNTGYARLYRSTLSHRWYLANFYYVIYGSDAENFSMGNSYFTTLRCDEDLYAGNYIFNDYLNNGAESSEVKCFIKIT